MTSVSQLSFATAWPVVVGNVLASHSTVMLAGEVENVGAVVSTTVTTAVAVAELPLSSVAVNVIVLGPK